MVWDEYSLKRVWFLRETIKFFLDENHLSGKKVKFFLGQYFFILDAIAESNIIVRGLMVSEYKDNCSFVYIRANSQEMPSNAMARAASATARGIFSWGAPRRRGL